MTYRDRVGQEHDGKERLHEERCPSDFGLENSPDCPFYMGWSTCEECWNRELEEGEET